MSMRLAGQLDAGQTGDLRTKRACRQHHVIAGDVSLLDERVLNGLDDTYKSLGVPTGPTVRGIALLSEVVCEQLLAAGLADRATLQGVVAAPFDHLCRGLAASNVRAR